MEECFCSTTIVTFSDLQNNSFCEIALTHDTALWLTSGQLSESEILHGACSYQRLLRVVQHMRKCVHANMIVCNVNTHSLFPHSRLIRVTGRLKDTVFNCRVELNYSTRTLHEKPGARLPTNYAGDWNSNRLHDCLIVCWDSTEREISPRQCENKV